MGWLNRYTPERECYAQLRSQPLKIFKYKELKKATRKFHLSKRIGKETYEGTLKLSLGGCTRKVHVAIKDLSRDVGVKDLNEWVAEIHNVHRKLVHPNIVRVIGYCAENDEKLGTSHCFLVYDFVEKGSFHDHLLLFKSHKPISWERRVRIAKETANALAYLHENRIMFKIFHSDKVLLDENLNVKLNYTVLPKLDINQAPWIDMKDAYICSQHDIQETMYRAPELLESDELSFKNDVWGFGTFLCELLRGRYVCAPTESASSSCIQFFSSTNDLRRHMDPRLRGKLYDVAAAKNLASIARMCLTEYEEQRPTMKEVIDMMNEVPSSSVTYSSEEEKYFSH